MRLRLFLSFALIVLISVSSFVLLARQRTADEVRGFMFRGGMAGVEELVSALEEYYQRHGSWQGVDSLLRASLPGAGRGPGPGGSGMAHGMGAMMNQRLILADAEGNVLADSSSSPDGRLSAAELRNAIPLNEERDVVGYLLTEGGMVFSQQDQQQLISRLNRAALTAGLIAGASSLALALLLAYRLLRPIRELTGAAECLAQGDLSQRVAERGDDELARLAQAFNRMADSLQKAGQSRRAMTADIAHELRNPLAVQRANLEALQDGIYPPTPENLEPILAQNRLLTRLVEDLQTLALADAGELELERTPADFPALVQRVVDRFQTPARANHIDLTATLPGICPNIDLDPGRVEQIIGNLLSNAMRYTPGGGSIQVRTDCSADQVSLSVHDSGPGIAAEALPHIFERFYRADKGRSRAEGGSGLGLAIARQLARAHGGDLTAQNHPQGGAVFILTIPWSGFGRSR